MPYNLTTGSPTKQIITIADGTIDTTSTSLAIPGRNYSGYGLPVDQDLIRLMEHFASANVMPNNAIRGQLWYSTTGYTPNANVSMGNATLSLCVVEETANTPAQWATVLTNPVNRDLNVSGNITATGNITGLNLIIPPPGLIYGQLANSVTFTNSGNGAALTPNSAIPYNGGNPVTISWNTLGAAQSAPLANNNPTISSFAPGISNPGGTVGANTANATLFGNWNIPAGNSLTLSNLAAGSNPGVFTGNWAFGPGNTLNGGNATTPTYLTGNWSLGPGATFQATYADLAERFEADELYDAGTVVEIGGEKEITAVREELSDRIFGVVSAHAAFMMNGGAGNNVTHPAIAISGRVPVKVVGTVRKGDRLVSAGSGRARAAKKEELTAFNTIGRALVDKPTDDAGTVLAIVTIK